MKKHWPILIIFSLAFIVRFLSVWPANTIIGFDQARDLFDSLKIIQGDLRIIGPVAGNNPNLHHGVAWLYFMIPPLIVSHNPISVVIWNSLFNAGVAVIVFFLAKDLFQSKGTGYISAILTAISYHLIQYSGWLSNPTGSVFTMSLFFLGIWKYYKGKSWGLPLAAFFLGLSIQFELFLVYLVPTGLILWLILKPKLPSFKIFAYSLFAIACALSTMIATEVKFHFAGIKSMLAAGSLVGGGRQFDFTKLFALNLWPQNKNLDLIFGVLVIGYLIYEMIKNDKSAGWRRNLFLLTWLFSPALMLILGSHNAPWFLIGRPAAAIAAGGYVISKLRPKFLTALVVILLCLANLTAIHNAYGNGQPLLEPDPSSILSKQIAVMDYTYRSAGGEAFAVDTVTNPLYINAVWAWDYDWYAPKYGFKPTWLGGDQLPPYNTLEKATGKEKYLFLLIDETPRIPSLYKEKAVKNMDKYGRLLEKKSFDGISVMIFVNRKF